MNQYETEVVDNCVNCGGDVPSIEKVSRIAAELRDIREGGYTDVTMAMMISDLKDALHPASCCKHGVRDGDWCDPCSKEYKRARTAPENQ